MPVEDFDWALLWRSQVPPVRREGFPTWCWAGWRGPLFYGQPFDVKKTRRIPTYLEVFASKSRQMKQIFAAKCNSPAHDNGLYIVLGNDPVDKASRAEPLEPPYDLDQYPSAEESGYLSITAIFLHFTPNFARPRTGTFQAGEHETFAFEVKDVRCLIRITSTDRFIPGHWDSGRWSLDEQMLEEWTCMLLARDHVQGFVLHHLMFLKMQKDNVIAERATVFELLVPLDDLYVLEEFKPQRRHIVLV